MSDSPGAIPEHSVVRFVGVTALHWAMWIALTASFAIPELVTGLAVAALASFITLAGPPLGVSRALLHPGKLVHALWYVVVLFVAIVRSNLDVARRVLSPTLRINPGIVRVNTRLKSPIARLILANSITLTPGTLTVHVEGEHIFVHWIDVQSTDAEQATREIVAGFEKHLEVIFG